jgi:chromosome segregation protein
MQERVQTQGKVTPWLQKHELDELPRLWQKLQIESRLGNRAGIGAARAHLRAAGVEYRMGQGFFSDAPPAKLALFAP